MDSMEDRNQISNLIYNYFFNRLIFCSYQYGEQLPSIDTLCNEFGVSAQTVKTALRCLREEGYIDMHRGRPTTVIFQQTLENAMQLSQDYFILRRDAYLDLQDCAGLLFPTLLAAGFQRIERNKFPYLSRLAERPSINDVLHFFSCVLQSLDNPLVMNLYWEITVFWGMPFLKYSKSNLPIHRDFLQDRMQSLLLLAQRQAWEPLIEELAALQRDTFAPFIAELDTRPPLPKEEQIPFSWSIYRERPQCCYSLAGRLLHEIYLGEYRDSAFLPSYQRMAEKYSVSLSTIRRTVAVLDQLGVLQPVNGKGVRVFSIGEPCRKPDFKSPAVRRNLSYFVQSFEILLCTCEPVSCSVLESVPAEAVRLLTEQFEHNLRSGIQELSLWHWLLFVIKNTRLQSLRDIYGRIYSLFLWGYPLKASQRENREQNAGMLTFTKRIIVCLKDNDFSGCGIAVRTLLSQQFPLAEQCLLRHGIPPEEIKLSPSIHLLLTGS